MKGYGALNQLKSIHAGHADICQQDIGHVVRHAVQCGDCIGAGRGQRDIQPVPVNHTLDTLADNLLIVNQQQFVHVICLAYFNRLHFSIAYKTQGFRVSGRWMRMRV